MCLCIYLPIHLLTYYIDTAMYVCAGAQSPLITLVTCAVSREGIRLRGVQEPDKVVQLLCHSLSLEWELFPPSPLPL